MKFAFIKSNRQVFDLGFICATFGVTPAGFYAWNKRPDGKRAVRQKTRGAGPLTQDLVIVGSDGDGRPGGPGGRSVANVRPVLTGNLCPADFDGDGTVDFFDYDAFVACFEGGPCPQGKTADFDGDGAVDFFDYDAFVNAFELGC